MISHRYSCIFIHIPRTAGTSIEHAICDVDWWDVNPSTKHVTAKQAKELYADYWDAYFKFSFVRNPWDRLVSCFHLGFYNGSKYVNPPIPQDQLHLFEDISVESFAVLSRDICKGGFEGFIDQFKPPPWEQNQLIEYTDILDVPLDFVGKFENISSDFEYIKDKIKLNATLPQLGKQDRAHYREYYNETTIAKVQALYVNSIQRFDYAYIA